MRVRMSVALLAADPWRQLSSRRNVSDQPPGHMECGDPTPLWISDKRLAAARRLGSARAEGTAETGSTCQATVGAVEVGPDGEACAGDAGRAWDRCSRAGPRERNSALARGRGSARAEDLGAGRRCQQVSEPRDREP